MLVALLLCFWQFQLDPIRHTDAVRMEAHAQQVSMERAQEQQAELRRKDFERRYNALIDAVKGFSEAYNRSSGGVWPANEARALRRAMHNLEKDTPLSRDK